jgi:predicted component of type VI protein secretion system
MRLTFPNGEHAAVNLEHGQVGVGSAAGGGTSVAIAGLSPLHAVFANGRRGSWLTVPQDATVVVNARPVKRIAYLRAGDLVCLGGVQVRVESDHPPASLAEPEPASRRRPLDEASAFALSKASLRGLSGPWFGRSIPLSTARVLGRGAGADVRLDGAGLQDRHAQIDIEDGAVVLRPLSPAATFRVNGHAVRGARLVQGDQIEIGEHRFVLEAPGVGQPSGSSETPVPGRREASTPPPAAAAPAAQAQSGPDTPATRRDLSGVYLLIAAAAALAAALTAFFVYAPKA